MRSAENSLLWCGCVAPESVRRHPLKPSAIAVARTVRSAVGVAVFLCVVQAGVAQADSSAVERQNQSLADHLAVAAQSAREAQNALSSGQVDACAAAVRKAKQSCKEVVGILTDRPSYDDQLGKPMNETLRALKDPRAVCDSAGTPDQGRTLAAVSDRLERLASGSPGKGH